MFKLIAAAYVFGGITFLIFGVACEDETVNVEVADETAALSNSPASLCTRDNYGGTCFRLRATSYNLNALETMGYEDNSARSVRIRPDCIVKIYSGGQLNGDSWRLKACSRGTDNFSELDDSPDNSVSSIRVVSCGEDVEKLCGDTGCDGKCSSKCRCGLGEGDCDSNDDCLYGLVCPSDGNGSEYCEWPGSGGGGDMGGDRCKDDGIYYNDGYCGYWGSQAWKCRDGDWKRVNGCSSSGGGTGCGGKCSSKCRCGLGEGDCDSNDDCRDGLICPPDGNGSEYCERPGSGGGGDSCGQLTEWQCALIADCCINQSNGKCEKCNNDRDNERGGDIGDDCDDDEDCASDYCTSSGDVCLSEDAEDGEARNGAACTRDRHCSSDNCKMANEKTGRCQSAGSGSGDGGGECSPKQTCKGDFWCNKYGDLVRNETRCGSSSNEGLCSPRQTCKGNFWCNKDGDLVRNETRCGSGSSGGNGGSGGSSSGNDKSCVGGKWQHGECNANGTRRCQNGEMVLDDSCGGGNSGNDKSCVGGKWQHGECNANGTRRCRNGEMVLDDSCG